MKKPSLDRINNDGDYAYKNCRFIEIELNSGRTNREKTKCLKGHHYSKTNTYIYFTKNKLGKKQIVRDCRICRRDADTRRRIKKRNARMRNF